MIIRIEDFRIHLMEVRKAVFLERLNTLSILLEKKIEVRDNLTKKLTSIDSDLSKKLLQFLNSDDIKDTADVDYVDYDKSNNKLFTIGYKDREGNDKKRLIKVNKLLSYLGSSISDVKDYEVEDLISHLSDVDTSELKLVSGADILYYYHCDNYEEGMTSCMSDDHKQKYLELYTANPGVVQLLVLVNPENNKVRGKALIWTLDNGDKFMDTIYTSNNEYNKYFYTYREDDDNSILRKVGTHTVTLDVDGEYDYYPYMDTFKYYTPDSGELSTEDGDLELTLTDGTAKDTETIYSNILGKFLDAEDAIYSKYYEDYILESESTTLTAGEHVGESVIDNHAVQDYKGDYILGKEAVELSAGLRKEHYALIDETVEDYNVETVLMEECVELTAGDHIEEWCLKTDAYVLLSGPNKDDIISKDDINDFEGIAMEKYVD